MRNVAIYRHQLFKRSEPFIHQQALNIPGFCPIFVGRERSGCAPGGAVALTMSDNVRYAGLVPRAMHAITRSPEPMRDLLATSNVALIHAHFGLDATYALRLSRRLDVPLVTTFHGMDVTVTGFRGEQLKSPAWINYGLFRRRLFQSGELFVCVSEFIRRKALALGVPEERTRVHYIGVDTTSITPSMERSVRPSILHVARLVEKKGTSDLLRAFCTVVRKFPDAELQIIGEGPMKASLIAQCESLGISHAVNFLGARAHADVLGAMDRAWIFCLPSVTATDGDSEGLGIVLLEAASSGVPVVATHHGGIPEAVVDGQTGFLHQERDDAAMADSLCLLIENTAVRSEMSAASRHHAVSHFDLIRQSAALGRLYEELM